MARKSHATPWLLGADADRSAHAQLRRARDPLANAAAALMAVGSPQGSYSSTRYGWQHFVDFCSATKRPHLPSDPATVVAFILNRLEAGVPLVTVRGEISAISRMHRSSYHRSPTHHSSVRRLVAGALRTYGITSNAFPPCRLPTLKALLSACPTDDIRDIQARAIFLLMYFGPLTTFQLIGLQRKNLAFSAEGVIISDVGKGFARRSLAIGYARESTLCPVKALKTWLAISDVKKGALFRGIPGHRPKAGKSTPPPTLNNSLSQWSLSGILKRALERSGLSDLGIVLHSFRNGFMLDALANGVALSTIAERLGFRRTAMLRKRLEFLGASLDEVRVAYKRPSEHPRYKVPRTRRRPI